jgi:hypothetical protein
VVVRFRNRFEDHVRTVMHLFAFGIWMSCRTLEGNERNATHLIFSYVTGGWKLIRSRHYPTGGAASHIHWHAQAAGHITRFCTLIGWFINWPRWSSCFRLWNFLHNRYTVIIMLPWLGLRSLVCILRGGGTPAFSKTPSRCVSNEQSSPPNTILNQLHPTHILTTLEDPF